MAGSILGREGEWCEEGGREGGVRREGEVRTQDKRITLFVCLSV